MGRHEQLKLAWELGELQRKKREDQHAFVIELDAQLEAALGRIEKTLGGLDVHKWLADRLTDDEEHPVSTTQVYDWLSRRNGRRPPGELLGIVYEHDTDFAAWWNKRHSYAVPEKLVLLPWEQERALYRKALAEFGAAGEQKLRTIASAKPDKPA